jgi:hypothetical protein
MKLSPNSIAFIEKYVLPQMGIEDVKDDNISDVVDFIVENFEIPLAQAKVSGESINDNLLDWAASVVTEITTNPEW